MKSTTILAVVTALGLILGTGCGRLKRFAYEGFSRDEWQHPEQVIGSLDIQRGDRVADLGAGGGYFTPRLAEAVGPSGRVFAVDVDKDMLEHVIKRTAEEGHSNVEAVLAAYHDPLLPESGVDLIFTSNTYHHLENRTTYFDQAKRYLRPGGRVAIIEHKRTGWFQKLFPHYTRAEVIRSEMQAAGYRLEHEYDFLERQSFLVFAAE